MSDKKISRKKRKTADQRVSMIVKAAKKNINRKLENSRNAGKLLS